MRSPASPTARLITSRRVTVPSVARLPPRRSRLVGALTAATIVVTACGSTASLSSRSTAARPSADPLVASPTAVASSQAPASATPRPPAAVDIQMSPTRLPQPVPARLSATIKVPHPVWLAAVDGAIWVTTDFGITRIDPASNKVSKTIKLGDGPGDLAWISGDGESLWVSEYDINVVDRIDPATGTVTAKIPVGQQPEGIAVASSGVWVANHHDGTVNRIDPTTNAVASTINVSAPGASGPQSVATGLGSIWVGIPKRKTVTRIDTATAAVVAEAYDPLPASPCGDIAIGPDAVWSSSCMDSPTLARIDPSTNAVVAMIGVGGEPDNGGMGAPVIVDGAPWVPVSTYIDRSSGTSRPGALVRIDPVTNTVDRVLDLGATFEPFGMVATSDSLWIVDNAPGADRVLRVPLSALGD